MESPLVRAEFLSWDAGEEPVDLDDPRMGVMVRNGVVVLQTWSAGMQRSTQGTDLLQLTLTRGQAHWLAGRLDTAAVAVRAEEDVGGS